MSVNKFEAIGIGISVGAMALALWFIRLETTTAPVVEAPAEESGVIVVNREGDQTAALANAIIDGSSARGDVQRLVVDDIVFGTGPLVEEGDTVTVHYIGSLQNGQQFDNSLTRGEPFTFTVGEGRVIPGWEQGIVGMQVGGERSLIIPSELAYGSNGAGPIPSNATLVFVIELLEIN